jgi:hypothetical protein
VVSASVRKEDNIVVVLNALGQITRKTLTEEADREPEHMMNEPPLHGIIPLFCC